MNLRAGRSRWSAAIAVASAIAMALAGCGESGSKAADLNPVLEVQTTPEFFTIPQDQMSHVQVLTVQPATLTRSPSPNRGRSL